MVLQTTKMHVALCRMGNGNKIHKLVFKNKERICRVGREVDFKQTKKKVKKM